MRDHRRTTVITAGVCAVASAALLTGCASSGTSGRALTGARGAATAADVAAALPAGAVTSPSGTGSRSGTASPSDGHSTTSPAADSSASPSAGSGTPSTSLSRLVLRRADLPDSFTATGPASTSAPDAAVDDALHTCLGTPRVSSQRTGGAVSASFRTGSAADTTYQGVTSSVVRYRSQATVESEKNLYRADAAQTCFRAQFDAQFDQFLEGRRILHRTVTVLPGSSDGPANVAAIVSQDVEYAGSDGRPATFRAALIVCTGPKLVGSLLLLGVGEQIDDELFSSLEGTLAARTAAA